MRALAAHRAEAADASVHELESELALFRETMARTKEDLTILLGDSKNRRMTRAAGELGAAIEAMEIATKNILGASEGIDDGARSLVAALKQDHERGLAQDIQEQTVKIFEACNFQDLAGQRMTKVIAVLTLVEEKAAAMLERCAHLSLQAAAAAARSVAGNSLVNGPKLDGDDGHAGQADIDAMFDERFSQAGGSGKNT
jgi:chemotaxis protein CheZ